MQQIQNQNIIEMLSLLINNNQQNKHDINEIIKYWINDNIIRCRPSTVDYYNKILKELLPIFRMYNVFYIEDITINKLNEIVSYLKQLKKYKNNTINKFICTIKQITHFSYKYDYTEYDLIQKYPKLKKDDVETIIINKSDITKILKYLETLDINNKINLRNILFIYLLKDTGARINEIRNIKLNNIDFETNTILLSYTKTNKNRKVYFTEPTKELLYKFIESVKPKDYIMCNVDTKLQINRANLYTFITKIKNECNISQSISPHKWRHTLATELVNLNINLENVRKLLGHSSLETTKKYLHVNDTLQHNIIMDALDKLNK